MVQCMYKDGACVCNILCIMQVWASFAGATVIGEATWMVLRYMYGSMSSKQTNFVSHADVNKSHMFRTCLKNIELEGSLMTKQNYYVYFNIICTCTTGGYKVHLPTHVRVLLELNPEIIAPF